MSRLVVALDQGSSSTRALALSEKGRVLARAQTAVATRRPRAGWFEHDAAVLAAGAERILDEAVSAFSGKEIVGLGIAAQRSTIVLWDAKTGKPLCPAFSWQDGRAADIVAPLQGRQEETHRVTGLYLTPFYSAPKIRWALDNVPAVARALEAGTLRAGPVSTWLIWKLTRGESFVCDPSMAQRTLLLDLETLDWSETMLALFGIPREILPRLSPSASEVGVVKLGHRLLTILASAGDQQAAALGLGGGAPGASVLNHGTGAFLLYNAGAQPRRVPGLLTSIGWRVDDEKPCYLVEGTVHAAGTSFEWLRDNLGVLKKGADVDRLCRASEHRLFALPAIGGLGAPRWDYRTPTTLYGLNSRTQPADVARAVTEGVGFLIADIVAAMRAEGLSPSLARASGGLSRLDYLLQFEADVTRMTIDRAEETEATAFGAASLAVEAAGDRDWAARLRRPKLGRTFTPRLDAGEAAALSASWRKFVDAQAALARSLA